MKVGDSNLITISIVVGVVLSLTPPAQPQTSADDLPMPVESRQDFIVKYKGKIFSWKKLLHQHIITLPHKNAIIAAVLEQKNSSHQSCKDRCFMDERKNEKTCFCDKACKAFGDCCLDFHSRCNRTGDDVVLQNVTCGAVDEHSWSGVIMKSSCSSHGHQTKKYCQTVERLNMTLQNELPVFDSEQNVTYRSIACARCNNEGDFSFWGLEIECEWPWSRGSITTPVNITAVKKFLKKRQDCSWKYAPMPNRKQQSKSCVSHDTQCASNKQPGMLSIVKELCNSYAMAFSVTIPVGWQLRQRFTYRNPHCAICNPEGKYDLIVLWQLNTFAPLPIILDVYGGSNTLPPVPQKEQISFLPGLPSEHGTQNLTQMLNCTSTMKNCKVTIVGQICEVSNSSNQSASHVVLMKQRQKILDNDTTDFQEKPVFIFCPEDQAGQANKGSTLLIYATFVGSLLSIISLCFLLSIYLSFKELRNLPGKCLINLSLALLCYQSIFLGAAKSAEINALCKTVAILIHFFLLAAFAWMSVLAFDSANTFKVKVRTALRQASDTKKTFIKYCIVGWGLPAVIVVLCSVLDFTATVHFGYGNSTYCWISNKTGIAVAVVTPVSFALVFNIVCFVKNAVVIRRLQQEAHLASNNIPRPSVTLICIKLTTVMGLTWILGLIANWKQTAFLHYPSTVLNSMQGFFIALCFTTTKKVRSLIKERFYKRSNGTVEPQANVNRDQCPRNPGAKTVNGSNAFEMKCLSIEQAKQNSS